VDPKQCFSWELVGKASKLGLRLLPLPVEYGGSGITDQSAQIIIMEELGAGDLGFASVFRSQISLVDMFMRLCNIKGGPKM
jgi:alkylation response protein AidB-like acyl-CoA dehydrogenase